ncbi:zinc finger protein 883-like [Centruroides sculpturatus]|uniref:zinc finger protein 883-like n=1 Tax=Centruroides sculpturatus TaxID=218467 RepID=UPI000C6DFD4B|nr:zinc finger protein 883-like [Centruroides sculpturatus]
MYPSIKWELIENQLKKIDVEPDIIELLEFTYKNCKKEKIKEENCDIIHSIKSECKVVLKRLNFKVKAEDCNGAYLVDEYEDLKPVKNEFFTLDENFHRNELNIQIKQEDQTKQYDNLHNSNTEKRYKKNIKKTKYVASVRKCNQVQKKIKRKYIRIMLASHSKQKFTCDLCKQTFINKGILKAHLLFHIGKKPFRCLTCNQKFSWQFLLRRHVREHNTENQIEIDNRKVRTKSSPKNRKKSNTGRKRLQCDICNQRAWSKDRLERHMRKHIPHRCKICNKEFKFECRLRTHEEVHSENRPFKCDICNKCYKTKKCLKIHYEIHSERRDYSCEICNKRFKTKRSLAHHKVIHSNEFNYSCEVCKKRFKRSADFKNHVDLHTNEYKYSCDICNKKFKIKRYLIRHQYYHIDRNKYVCDICKTGFKHKYLLVTHRFVKHEDMFVCKYCTAPFRTENMLKAHLKNHIEKCNVCNKEFKDKRCFILHQKSHYEVKPFLCETCNRGFRTKYLLKCHESYHNQDNYRHVCEVCEKGFDNKTNFLKHQLIHAEKPYPCINCKRKFETESELKYHLKFICTKIHPKQSPYQCNICKETYINAHDLERHLNTYNYEMHFCCDICRKKFTRKVEFESHRKTAHPSRGKHRCNICKKTFKSEDRLKRHVELITDTSVKKCDICNKKFCTNLARSVHVRSHL